MAETTDRKPDAEAILRQILMAYDGAGTEMDLLYWMHIGRIHCGFKRDPGDADVLRVNGWPDVED